MMTAEQLKASILQLAMEGKLVEQRPEEGTGEELYQKIQAEKNKLIKEGKIKKEKPFPEITDDEKPFDIPVTWKWARVGEVGDWASGATPSRSHLEYYGGDIPWLKTGDLNDSYITDIPEKITKTGMSHSSVRLNPVGSVLMAMYGATIGKLGILNIPATTNQACCACICSSYVSNRFLFYFLLSRRKAFIEMGAGGAQPNISKVKIVTSCIPLPPLEEQKRIVNKIDEVMPYVAQYATASEKLEKLNTEFPNQVKKSILQMAVEGKLVEQRPEEGTGEELFRKIQEEKAKLIKEGKIKKQKPCAEITDEEKPFDIPESWIWVRLNEVSTIVTGGTPSKAHPEYYGGPIPFYKPADIQSTPYMESVSETLSAQGGEHARIIPCKSIAVSCIGNIGKSAMLPSDGTTNQQINSICYYCFPEYMYWYTQSQLFISQLVERASMTTLPIVNKSKMETCLFPMPPLEEQKRIVTKINAVIPVIDLIAT